MLSSIYVIPPCQEQTGFVSKKQDSLTRIFQSFSVQLLYMRPSEIFPLYVFNNTYILRKAPLDKYIFPSSHISPTCETTFYQTQGSQRRFLQNLQSTVAYAYECY